LTISTKYQLLEDVVSCQLPLTYLVQRFLVPLKGFAKDSSLKYYHAILSI